MYSAKFKVEPQKLMRRLWGDQFFNAKDKKWSKNQGEGYVRGFNKWVLDPIFKVNFHVILCKVAVEQGRQLFIGVFPHVFLLLHEESKAASSA